MTKYSQMINNQENIQKAIDQATKDFDITNKYREKLLLLKNISQINNEQNMQKKIEQISKTFNITFKELFEQLGVTSNAYQISKLKGFSNRLKSQIDMFVRIKELELLLELKEIDYSCNKVHEI